MVPFLSAYSKVLLIGNSKSVLEKKLGEDIDRFDVVCRFNNFQIEPYEEYIGTKTDIVCRRSCDDVKLHDADKLLKILNFVTYGKWSAGMVVVARRLKSFYKDKVENVNIDECAEFGKLMGLDQPVNEFASIGALACAWFAKYHDPKLVVLHGFGYNDTHYWPRPPNDSQYHNWQKEQKFVTSLGFSFLAS